MCCPRSGGVSRRDKPVTNPVTTGVTTRDTARDSHGRGGCDTRVKRWVVGSVMGPGPEVSVSVPQRVA